MNPINAALQIWQERWPRKQRFLIGVSGGVDSIVLLRSLCEKGYKNLVVCHLDHGLRGRISTADARWVVRLAAILGLPCLTEKCDVRAEADVAGVSVETAGREARHRFFARIARHHRCPRVLLAHHADDQAETVLMNLCRGSAGLAGRCRGQAVSRLRARPRRQQALRPSPRLTPARDLPMRNC